MALLINQMCEQESREEGGMRNEGFEKTSKLFKHHIGADIVEPGAGYRGDAPPDRYGNSPSPRPWRHHFINKVKWAS